MLRLMLGNALAYYLGLFLMLWGVDSGLSMMVATTNVAFAYLMSKYVHMLQRFVIR